MPLSVWPLSGAKFFSSIANRWIDATQVERESRQARYILGYLQKPQVAARCFVVEEPYVDGDYLEDFASFYVTSFPPYDRYCRRLHFFDRDFSQSEMDDILMGDDVFASKLLQDSYVGFIVVRPLPQAVIGRTVLRTYREPGAHRSFPTLRNYTPHLNGIPLPIQSLAFEEQDTSVAACATVALWSAFHKTHDLFGLQRVRPATITRSANAVRSQGRALPSKGLNPAQIGEAVRAVGLDPEFYSFTSATPVASLMYAYLSAGLPLILGVYIEDLGNHAVTVVGYSETTGLASLPEPPFGVVKSRPGCHIDKFYVHDDGVGPFAVMPIVSAVPGISTPVHNIKPPFFLESDWPLPTAKLGRTNCNFLPEWIIVPAYGKMRVSYFAIQQWVRRLTEVFFVLRAQFLKNNLDVDAISWDIKLTLVNDFKVDLRSTLWSNLEARSLAGESLPRFMWTATMYVGDVATRLLIFDATDTERTCPLLRAIWLDATHSTMLDTMFADPGFAASWRIPLTPQLYDTLKTGRASFL